MTMVQQSVNTVVSEQSFIRRYKGSLLIVATGVTSILAQLAVHPEIEGTITAAILTGIVTTATMLTNRFTQDGVTPSMAERLEDAVEVIPTTAPDDTPAQHRAPDGPTYGEGSTAPSLVGSHRVEQ